MPHKTGQANAGQQQQTGQREAFPAHIEKRASSTFDLLLFLSKAVKVSERRIGYAGLKDARALTRQSMSVARLPPERVLAVLAELVFMVLVGPVGLDEVRAVLHQIQRFASGNVSDNDKRRVVRYVPRVVPGLELLQPQ